MEKRHNAARPRRLEAEHHRLDMTAEPRDMTNEQIAASIYRLQGRRGRFGVYPPGIRERIQTLVIEQRRRHNLTRNTE